MTLKSCESLFIELSARFESIWISAEILFKVLKRKCGLSWFFKKSSSYCNSIRFRSRSTNARTIWRNIKWYKTHSTQTKQTNITKDTTAPKLKCPLTNEKQYVLKNSITPSPGIRSIKKYVTSRINSATTTSNEFRAK